MDNPNNHETDRRRQDINEKINDLKIDLKESIAALSTKFALIEYKTNIMLLALAFLATTIGGLLISEGLNRLKNRPTSSSILLATHLIKTT